jgi:lipid II:glycine glycyltransferase (peptidoglycan interpeptide bridge formation enzyme)
MLREITDKTEWKKLHQALIIPSGHFLQSWEWGEFQISLGRKVFRFADKNFLAQIIELSLPLGKKYWFVPKGPISSSHDPQSTIQEPASELKNKAKEAGAVFLRLEPIGSGSSADEGELSLSEVWRGLATKFGAKYSHDINPRATSIIDLSQTEEELLATMHPKTRYNIHISEKHGVAVGPRRPVNGALFDRVWELFTETAKRDGFRLHLRGYYEKQINMPGIEVYGAEYDGKLLAAAVVMFENGTATYLHGASSNALRNVMAPYALHWTIMKQAKERGFTHYDLWGISDDPKSGWTGITRFKRGFGGVDVLAIGTLDLPMNRFWYSVYRLARRLRS